VDSQATDSALGEHHQGRDVTAGGGSETRPVHARRRAAVSVAIDNALYLASACPEHFELDQGSLPLT
jgi:hypothetical protein